MTPAVVRSSRMTGLPPNLAGLPTVWPGGELGGRPQDIRDEYIRRSPSSYTDRPTTPTLIIEGEEEHRCLMNQAEQMFVLLKKAGVETQFARYPAGSGMVFALAIPELRADLLRRTLRWYQDRIGAGESYQYHATDVAERRGVVGCRQPLGGS